MTRVKATETELSYFEKRFVPEPNTGCFLWIGNLSGTGYGRFQWKGKERLAHRVAWELHRGPIPDGLCVCHKCDQRHCVNPDHFFLGTNADNTADKCRKGRQSRSRLGGAPGERNSHAKLNEEQVITIRARAAAGERLADIARDYQVSDGLVSMIATRRVWKHVGMAA